MTVNEYGRGLLQLRQLRIVNGRVGNDKGKGKYTCFTRLETVLLIMLLPLQILLTLSTSLKLAHCQKFLTTAHCCLKLNHIPIQEILESLPIQLLKIQPGDRRCVLKCFKSTARRMLDYLMEKIYELPLNQCVQEFSQIHCSNLLSPELIITRGKINRFPTNTWFDDEAFKRKFSLMATKMKLEPEHEHLRDLYWNHRKK